jgi:hypothetical protein
MSELEREKQRSHVRVSDGPLELTCYADAEMITVLVLDVLDQVGCMLKLVRSCHPVFLPSRRVCSESHR